MKVIFKLPATRMEAERRGSMGRTKFNLLRRLIHPPSHLFSIRFSLPPHLLVSNKGATRFLQYTRGSPNKPFPASLPFSLLFSTAFPSFPKGTKKKEKEKGYSVENYFLTL